MVIVVFRARTRSDIDEAAYGEAFEEMVKLVSQVPGYLGIDTYAGQDGEELALAAFESLEALEAWKHDPDHVAMQARGRDEFFVWYRILVAQVIRENSGGAPEGLPEGEDLPLP